MVALALRTPSERPASANGLSAIPGGFLAPSTRTPLSALAWGADRLGYGEWIERSGFTDFPWMLSPEGKREAQRRRQLASAKGEHGSLTERSSEVLRDALQWCFGDAAWCLLLGWIQTSGLRISGVRSGVRMPIDEALLPHIVVDLAQDTATTSDGGTTWHALAVESSTFGKANARTVRRSLRAFGVRMRPAR